MRLTARATWNNEKDRLHNAVHNVGQAMRDGIEQTVRAIGPQHLPIAHRNRVVALAVDFPCPRYALGNQFRRRVLGLRQRSLQTP